MPKLLSACVIGKPNAGKSTLTNLLLGQKLSIVTPKVQTTRSIITGIFTINDTQVILFDTPGIFTAKRKLEKAMVRCAWSSLHNADLVTLIIDSSKEIDENLQAIIKKVRDCGKKIVVLLNKIDIPSKHYVSNMALIEEMLPMAKILNISALKSRNITDFTDYLQDQAFESPWSYEADELTTLPARFLASEITREQLFMQLQQELPYNLSVKCEQWKELKDGSVRVNQVIMISRDSYKNMIIGKNGSRIKEIGQKARKNIESLIGKKIHLFLFVKVTAYWDSSEAIL